MPKLTKRLVEAIEPGTRDVFAWDTELKGFGVRVYPSGQRRYLLQWKRNGKTRRYVIGAHGPLTTEQARVRAVKLLGRIANGDDPAEERDAAKADLTVRELIDLYLTEGAAHLKGGSRAAYRSVFVRHVLPLLGGQKARTLKSADIVKLIDDVANGVTAGRIEGESKKRGRVIVRGGRGIAARTRQYLGAAFTWAVRRALLEVNPCDGVKKPKTRTLERHLNYEEFQRLGSALAKAVREGANPNFAAAVELLMLTGCRAGEIKTLRWSEVDLEAGLLRLADSKTGARLVPLPAMGRAILATQSRVVGSPWVFPSSRGPGPIVGLRKFWVALCRRAGIENATLHTLRHSLASTAVQSGASLYLVGKALGHSQITTTQRYSHVHVDPVAQVVEAAAGRIAAALQAGEAEAEPKPMTELPSTSSPEKRS